MNDERDEFLAIVIGESQYEFPKFSTWIDFGKLWEWSIVQEWWDDFIRKSGGIVYDKAFMIRISIVNPDEFANAVYKYLKGE